ncbi:DUF4367 domain-containing protein [Anaerovirgula multivorans]|uniref:DUF4367 domain-containing protein n=1 Tax=Anaerovirgula multivorans TaxID=312168 RepID=UPI000B783F45|nr:DUF4367 domain-containing protein [Anaerovirgula multivorans]
MKNFDGINKNTSIEANCSRRSELDRLEKLLQEQMKFIKDERDIDKLRETIGQMEEIEPIKVEISAKDFLTKFKKETLPKAKKAREDFLVLQKNKGNTIKPILSTKFYRVVFTSMMLLILLNMGTLVFAGINIFKPFITWTEETFIKKSVQTKQNDQRIDNSDIKVGEITDATLAEGEYMDFESIEKEYNIKILKPSYLFEAYVVKSIVVSEFEESTEIFATYINENHELYYRISVFKSGNTPYNTVIEKSNEPVEVYRLNGIDYYIMKNIDVYVATWNENNADYLAMGFDNLSTVKMFIENLIK